MKKTNPNKNTGISKNMKLIFKRETIAILADVQLRQVVGASGAGTGCTSGDALCDTN